MLCQSVFGHGAGTASTAHVDLSFVLAVKIDQVFPRHESRLQPHGPRESGLLITGEKAFQWAVRDVRGFQNGHLHRDTDTIVSSQGCAPCLEPFSFHIGLDGVSQKIVFNVSTFFADHVGVALQHNGGTVLVSRSGRFSDQHVAGFVHQGLQSQLLSKCFQEFNDALLVFGGAGHLIDACEAVKDGFG